MVQTNACERTKVREIRYDHGRRYMVQSNSTDPNANSRLRPLGDAVWTEFDGGAPVRDISIPTNGGGAVTDTRLQQLGAWQYTSATAQTHFFHTDHIGTTQIMTNAAGQIVQYQSFTAFGEPADDPPFASLTQPTSPLSRYGFAGAHGYESLPPPHADDNFPYLHLGARYYDPEIGRFLQRDPIGIAGGLNVYAYCHNNPVVSVDPDGENQYVIAATTAMLVAATAIIVIDALSDGNSAACFGFRSEKSWNDFAGYVERHRFSWFGSDLTSGSNLASFWMNVSVGRTRSGTGRARHWTSWVHRMFPKSAVARIAGRLSVIPFVVESMWDAGVIIRDPFDPWG